MYLQLTAAILMGIVTPSTNSESTEATIAEDSFRLSGAEFKVPPQEGLCPPSGKNIDLDQLVAAADTQNITHYSLLSCSEQRDDKPIMNYLIIKSPKQALTVRVNRKAFLDGLGQAFENPEFKKYLESGEVEREVEKGFSEVANQKLRLDTSIEPYGRDDVCGYLGGIAKYTQVPETYAIAMGACLTSIADRVIFIYHFGDDLSPEGIGSLMLKSKLLAESIEVVENVQGSE